MIKVMPTNPSANPLAGQLIYDELNGMFKCYTGTSWIEIGLSSNYCVLCKVSDWDHGSLQATHPFVRNNLELLEWKLTEHESKNNNNTKVI